MSLIMVHCSYNGTVINWYAKADGFTVFVKSQKKEINLSPSEEQSSSQSSSTFSGSGDWFSSPS